MSSPSSSGNSLQQKDSTKTSSSSSSIEKIIEKLTDVRKRIRAREDKPKPHDVGSTPAPEKETQGDVDDESTKQKKDEHAVQLEKVCKEVDYIVRAFEKLKKFEDDLILSQAGQPAPLETLEHNVDDILKDLKRSSNASSLKQIERNLKVLRSNITKVKIQIPLQHQASNLISDASRYLQATVASREAGDLPNLYQAADILERGSFFREIKHKYDSLGPDDVALQLCLLCFAIFPENAEVKQSLLRFWWIGERLTEQKEQVDEMVRVNDILDVLVKEGFIEPVKKKSRLSPTSYTMHPIIRSLLIRLAEKANFFDYDPKGNPTNIFTMPESKKKTKTCLIKTEDHWLSKNVSQSLNPNNPEKPADSEKQKKEKEKQQQQKYLEDLHNYLAALQTVFNINKQFPDLPVEEFSKMRSIGVLYLGRWEKTAERHMEVEKTDFLKAGLVNMKKLRLFSLQGISGINTLPDSVCKLMNLRILDLRACHNLVELPKQLGSLKKLTYLDLSECYLIDNMPKQLASLSQLRVLKGFVISSRSRHSCTLQDLAALPKLMKLTINVSGRAFQIDEEGEVLSKFQALQKLRIAWGAVGEGSSKSTNGGDKEKSEANPTNTKPAGNTGGKKTNGIGNQDRKRQQIDASKCGKLKMPWGVSCGEGSSKTAAKIEISKGDNKTPAMFTKLEKLDLQCFPRPEPPSWLVPGSLTSLKSLYIRGGKFSYLGDISTSVDNKKWDVEFLRLKYLGGVQINWKDLQTQFPKLKYLERVKCPGIICCPCDADGVWQWQDKA